MFIPINEWFSEEYFEQLTNSYSVKSIIQQHIMNKLCPEVQNMFMIYRVYLHGDMGKCDIKNIESCWNIICNSRIVDICVDLICKSDVQSVRVRSYDVWTTECDIQFQLFNDLNYICNLNGELDSLGYIVDNKSYIICKMTLTPNLFIGG